MGLLEEQQELLITEPSLQHPPNLYFKRTYLHIIQENPKFTHAFKVKSQTGNTVPGASPWTQVWGQEHTHSLHLLGDMAKIWAVFRSQLSTPFLSCVLTAKAFKKKGNTPVCMPSRLSDDPGKRGVTLGGEELNGAIQTLLV